MPRGVKKEKEVTHWLVQNRWGDVKWVDYVLSGIDTVLAYGWDDGSVTWKA